MVVDYPGLSQPVEISISDVSIQEFLRGVASTNELNISVDSDLQIPITNNFSNATASEIFLYLCKEYDLEIDFTGSILSFRKYVAPPLPVEPKKARTLDIAYTGNTDFLSFSLKNDTLYNVAKTITSISSKNVVVPRELENLLVSGYIQNRPFDDALAKLAFANGLEVDTTDKLFYVIKSREQEEPAAPANPRRRGAQANTALPASGGFNLEVNNGLLSVDADDIAMSDVIKAISAEMGTNYFMIDVPDGRATLMIDNVDYESFLSYLLNGTNYTYRKSDDVYLIGLRNQERLRTSELIRLENRTIETVMDFIPQELQKDIDIQEFVDLNGLIVSGSYLKVEEIKTFLREIDLPVPVVLIDLMIVEVNKNYNIETGISLSLGGEDVPTNTTGSFNGVGTDGISATLSSKTLNDLLNGFTAPGFINLGNLAPDFYASVRALEENGVIRQKSTPKLATLNGTEASLSLGETRYYADRSSNIIGAQAPTVSNQRIFKPINADLTIVIKPVVAGDEQITLDIEFIQSNFTESTLEEAPPNSVNRSFKSTIRIRNGETILLGGLDEKNVTRSGKGLPLIARIPVIKWIFGSNSRRDAESQINIFVSPTVIF